MLVETNILMQNLIFSSKWRHLRLTNVTKSGFELLVMAILMVVLTYAPVSPNYVDICVRSKASKVP